MAKKNSRLSFWKILILIMGTGAIVYAMQLYFVQRSKLVKYQQEIEQLKKENAMLERTLKQADTPFMTEKIAREQLGMMKKGEYRIQIKEEKHVSD